MNITAINNDLDHERALNRIQELWKSDPGTDGAIERDYLASLVDDYESIRYPSCPADPLVLVKFRLKEKGWSQNQLGKAVGCSSGRISEVLNGKRALTVDMIRKLSLALEIPPGMLVLDSAEATGSQWLKVPSDLMDQIEAEVATSSTSVDVWVRRVIEGALAAQGDTWPAEAGVHGCVQEQLKPTNVIPLHRDNTGNIPHCYSTDSGPYPPRQSGRVVHGRGRVA